MSLNTDQRQALLIELLRQHLQGKLTQGEVLQQLRKEVLGFTQTRYAELVGVSRRTLTDIEQNKGSQTQSVINKVFKPFGIQMGLIPTQSNIAHYLLHENSETAAADH
ncbi:helix-turn-helix domain-containing protein [Oceanospirillum linum]|uniref:Transcriptional regulator n=1 Tax=Oceanospirillum linum TaxID=966 RepID=A0A1T1HEF6_OCELI|nr:helix-turn-helix domain-containing protein [Oceanospirillum linum]OOV88195.1 transcriptional regulator [Oceanospirillum linum]SEF47291.1 DNA-binding transcriptional regulator, XRE-family HTH domain [Oleiphilus messinensis]SMP02393.1 DNA-binding transcriptional regulator, XRE-family HTH domain [Oceanospirillum linum]